MADDRITVTFTCKACGKKSTTLSLPDNPTDASIASCKNCGAEVGRYGDIKAQAKKTAVDAMQKRLRSALKGFKGIRVK